MDTVTASSTFEGDLQVMVDRCRSLDSRRFWPGAQLMGSREDLLSYQVSMRLKAATMTDIDVAEKLSPVVQAVTGGVVFTTTQRCVWPDGVADGETEYRFEPGTPHTLTFTYRYEAPSVKLVKPKALPAFHEGMQKVASRYVAALTAAPAHVSVP